MEGDEHLEARMAYGKAKKQGRVKIRRIVFPNMAGANCVGADKR